MPLVMCPNCNASMQEVQRAGVAFDMCPTCRGIWLDRGELEKLIESGRQQVSAFETDRDAFYRDPDAYRRQHPKPYDDDDDDRRRYGHDPRYKKKRGFDLFDIFD